MKHTHKGICQVCGRLQAMRANGGLIARHGYKHNKWSYFTGQCAGSNQQPLNYSHAVTDATIESLLKYNKEQLEDAEAYTNKTKLPQMVSIGQKRNTMGKWINNYVPYAEAAPQYQISGLRNAEYAAWANARHASSHMEFLRKLKVQWFNKAPKEVESCAV